MAAEAASNGRSRRARARNRAVTPLLGLRSFNLFTPRCGSEPRWGAEMDWGAVNPPWSIPVKV
ncbi:hypothetical protein GCM10010245_18490 [Streptomyces spectabilis]|nr:hypothetical protein GCM10010245_18490 [Streptomyces spectabilis]